MSTGKKIRRRSVSASSFARLPPRAQSCNLPRTRPPQNPAKSTRCQLDASNLPVWKPAAPMARFSSSAALPLGGADDRSSIPVHPQPAFPAPPATAPPGRSRKQRPDEEALRTHLLDTRCHLVPSTPLRHSPSGSAPAPPLRAPPPGLPRKRSFRAVCSF